jgi:hypothetical protein
MVQDLYFDSDKHIYYVNGEKVPSVSDLLKPIDLVALENIPPQYLAIASERGTRVHEACEFIDLYGYDEWLESESDENIDISGYVDAYVRFKEEIDYTPYNVEEAFFSPTMNVCGTIDRICMVNGNRCIVDLKSGKMITLQRAEAQLSFYKRLWEENHTDKPIKKLYILQLANDSTYKFVEIKYNEKIVETLTWLYATKGEKI